MTVGALLGAAGAGGGHSLQGGSAGGADSGISANNSFNIGGNAGIGSSSGGLLGGLTDNPQSLAIIGLMAIGVAVVITRGKR